MNLMDEIHKDCSHIRTIANAIGHLSDDIEIRSIAGLDLPSSPAQPIDARSIHDRAITIGCLTELLDVLLSKIETHRG